MKLGLTKSGLTALVAGGLLAAQPTPPNPYDHLPTTTAFQVTSNDLGTGRFSLLQMGGMAGGGDKSPQIQWTDVPKGTRSFAVTMYDPDAPTPSGFWHWVVVDIPADVRSLPSGAGAPEAGLLPKGAFHLPNDVRMARYIGAAPPPGTGIHRYFIVIHALDVPTLGLPHDITPAFLSFNLLSHTLGRATLIITAGTP